MSLASWRRVGDGLEEDRKKFLTQVPEDLRNRQDVGIGIRKYGVIRIDSASSPEEWAKDPVGNTKKIAETFRAACDIAESYGDGYDESRDMLGRDA